MKKIITIVLAAILSIAPRALSMDKKWFENIEVNGMVSLGYSYNFNKPITDLNGYRLFDEDANSFNVDVAEIVIQRQPSQINDVGFRFDFTAGGAIPEKTASIGLTLGDVFDIQQAYGSYIAPIGSGLRFDIGKHITHMGYEVIEGYDGYNDHYTRSLLFNYAIPLTHTGIKASYSFSDKVSAMVGIFNGWDNVEDNNNSKSIGANLTIKPFIPLTIYLNYMGGPEQATGAAVGVAGVGGDDINRDVFDLSAVLTPTDKWTFAVNYDYGTEDKISNVVNGRDAHWNGIAGYIKYIWSDKLSFALRAEKFDDRDAVRLAPWPAGGPTATQPTDITEITFTPAYKFTDNFLLRIEGRWDKSNRNIFVKENNIFVDDQTTVSANAIFTF